MQNGVILMVATYDAKGEKLEDFDSPNGKNGPELFILTSIGEAEYMIEVYPFNKIDQFTTIFNHILNTITMSKKNQHRNSNQCKP